MPCVIPCNPSEKVFFKDRDWKDWLFEFKLLGFRFFVWWISHKTIYWLPWGWSPTMSSMANASQDLSSSSVVWVVCRVNQYNWPMIDFWFPNTNGMFGCYGSGFNIGWYSIWKRWFRPALLLALTCWPINLSTGGKHPIEEPQLGRPMFGISAPNGISVMRLHSLLI